VKKKKNKKKKKKTGRACHTGWAILNNLRPNYKWIGAG